MVIAAGTGWPSRRSVIVDHHHLGRALERRSHSTSRSRNSITCTSQEEYIERRQRRGGQVAGGRSKRTDGGGDNPGTTPTPGPENEMETETALASAGACSE